MSKKTSAVVTTAFIALTGPSFAGPGHGDDFGHPGAEAKVDRTIEILMTEMEYSPSEIEVKEGETIKFIIRNDGRAIHEFNIGVDETWQAHRKEMHDMFKMGLMNTRRINHEKMMSSGMMHDDPNSVLLEPGEEAELIWEFSKRGEFGFACNVPGHFEAGMAAPFRFVDESGS